jgi:hypothetical protein
MVVTISEKVEVSAAQLLPCFNGRPVVPAHSVRREQRLLRVRYRTARGLQQRRRSNREGKARAIDEGNGYSAACRREAPERENPAGAGLSEERLIGFEPTTFCMASRRSSQLSYSRASGEYSQGEG